MLPFFTLSAKQGVIEDRAAVEAVIVTHHRIAVLASRARLVYWIVVALAFMPQAGIRFAVAWAVLVAAVFAFVGCYHIFVSVDHPPNHRSQAAAQLLC